MTGDIQDPYEGQTKLPMSQHMVIVQYIAFMLMGAGANWVLPTALAQEIPYFEDHAPEKLCVATYMNVANACGVTAMLTYMYVHNHVTAIPYTRSVPLLLLGSTLGSFFSALVYPLTVGGVSLFLFICAFIGGAIGSLSSVIMNPFMTGFKSHYISAARSGGSFYIVLCALIALPQDPGSENVRFSPRIYFIVFGCLLVPPLIAYWYITSRNIGKRTLEDEVGMNGATSSTCTTASTNDCTSTNDVRSNPIFSVDADNSTVFKIETAGEEQGRGGSSMSISSGGRSNRQSNRRTSLQLVAVDSYIQQKINNWFVWIGETIVSDSRHEKMPYLRESLPFMVIVGWINFNTWGMITALTPFAMSFASQGSGAVNLAYAYQLGGVGLVCGDFSTTFFKIPIWVGMFFFNLSCLIIYTAASGAPGYRTALGPAFLVTVFSLQRFVESHMITSTYRAVAASFPDGARQLASGAVGICDVSSTTVGALLSLAIVVTQYNC